MKYNILEDKDIEPSVQKEETSCSLYKDASTFLRSGACSAAKTSLSFNFVALSPLDIVLPFFISITRQRFSNIYYGYDSTAFCIVRSTEPLEPGVRYIVYGKLSKGKRFFLDSMKATVVDYKELCYWLL
ncbi:hypothetical protein PAPHI01_0767 [Pancytospora philotis]|nr:hypothetical protein PAPHI01_0767 [Pancytospora philotis]